MQNEPGVADADAVHEFRRTMKRWRAFLRLLEPFIGAEARRLRIEARDLARGLAGARNARSALDALADLGEDPALSPRSRATIKARLDALRLAAEGGLTADLRARIDASLAAAAESITDWPLGELGFPDLAAGLVAAYRRARRAVPDDWSAADAETLHALRQRVVVHRYEAQRLRDRLGHVQDLEVLVGLSAAHQPLAPWRSRLAPLITARQAEHVHAAARLAGRLFAEPPKAFRRRLVALWEQRSHA